nr:MAG: hypothetical protein [Rhabdoviridae sp.]
MGSIYIKLLSLLTLLTFNLTGSSSLTLTDLTSCPYLVDASVPDDHLICSPLKLPPPPPTCLELESRTDHVPATLQIRVDPVATKVKRGWMVSYGTLVLSCSTTFFGSHYVTLVDQVLKPLPQSIYPLPNYLFATKDKEPVTLNQLASCSWMRDVSTTTEAWIISSVEIGFNNKGNIVFPTPEGHCRFNSTQCKINEFTMLLASLPAPSEFFPDFYPRDSTSVCSQVVAYQESGVFYTNDKASRDRSMFTYESLAGKKSLSIPAIVATALVDQCKEPGFFLEMEDYTIVIILRHVPQKYPSLKKNSLVGEVRNTMHLSEIWSTLTNLGTRFSREDCKISEFEYDLGIAALQDGKPSIGGYALFKSSVGRYELIKGQLYHCTLNPVFQTCLQHVTGITAEGSLCLGDHLELVLQTLTVQLRTNPSSSCHTNTSLLPVSTIPYFTNYLHIEDLLSEAKHIRSESHPKTGNGPTLFNSLTLLEDISPITTEFRRVSHKAFVELKELRPLMSISSFMNTVKTFWNTLSWELKYIGCIICVLLGLACITHLLKCFYPLCAGYKRLTRTRSELSDEEEEDSELDMSQPVNFDNQSQIRRPVQSALLYAR